MQTDFFLGAETTTQRQNPVRPLVSELQCGHQAEELGQYMTPEFVAERLVTSEFAGLTPADRVADIGCGRGAFLKAVPQNIPAFGVEIDPALAAEAVRNTGRPVVTGDFRFVELPMKPTVAIGNPPFSRATVSAFLDRLHDLFPDGGRAGFILPAYHLQTSFSVQEWAEKWSMKQTVIPRDIFPNLKCPLNWVVFTKERVRKMVGFFLFSEQAEVRSMKQSARLVLIHGRPKLGAWVALFDAALEAHGGEASLQEIYRFCGDPAKRPSENTHWAEQLRKVARSGRYVVVSRGVYRRYDPIAA